MKETRAKFIPPAIPKEDMMEIVQYIRRLNVLLPQYLDMLQKSLLEAQAMLYDVQVAVPDDENVVNAEDQYANTDSAGLL